MEKRPPQHLGVEAIAKRAFGLPLTKTANFTFTLLFKEDKAVLFFLMSFFSLFPFFYFLNPYQNFECLFDLSRISPFFSISIFFLSNEFYFTNHYVLSFCLFCLFVLLSSTVHLLIHFFFLLMSSFFINESQPNFFYVYKSQSSLSDNLS